MQLQKNLTLKAILTIGMLIFGTVNTLTKKIQNDSVTTGINGDKHSFNHPWYFKKRIGVVLLI